MEDIIDIDHAMKLAKLDLNKEDSEHLSQELNKILHYIDILKGADVSGIDAVSDELDYNALVGETALAAEFYKDCRLDECDPDNSFDFNIVKSNAPSFEADTAGSGQGFFVVPQVIE